MEHQLWKAMVALTGERSKGRYDPRATYPDDAIARVSYWAVIHDRPTRWAVRRDGWPAHPRRGRALPSAGTTSRRRRARPARDLLDARDRRVPRPAAPGVFGAIDGQPLPVGGCSRDQQAAGRLRSIGRTEGPLPAFARGLLRDRAAVERAFGNLTRWGGGPGPLPAGVRTHRRVARWVQAELVLTRLKQNGGPTTYAA